MTRRIDRLLLATDAGSFGGAERYVIDMAAAAERRGIKASIFWLPCRATGENFFAGAAGHCSSPPGMSTAGLGRPGAWRTLREFGRHVRAFGPDAVVINASGKPGFWITTWHARLANIPCAWVHHMVDGRDIRRLPAGRLGGRIEGPGWWRIPQAARHRLAAEGSQAVIVSNPADRDHIARWHGVARPRIRIIPPGVDTNRFAFDPAGRERFRDEWAFPQSPGNGTGPIVVGTAARLVARKGIEALLEAIARLRERNLPVVAAIAGDGPDRLAYQALARQRGIGEHVRFAGFVKDMAAFYSALDLFVLCSETESFGLALAEARLCGRPVISSPTAGGRQQISHLENGWLLEGFGVGPLVEALIDLCTDAALSGRLAMTAATQAHQASSIDHTLDGTLAALGFARQ